MEAPDPITVFVRTLETMNLRALRCVWQERYGAPPKLRSPDLLRRLLAWRIQADAWGGLDRATYRKILAAGRAKTKPKPAVPKGVRLIREWQGMPHEVESTDKGFLYDGAVYRSLSAVARQITGVRWNGPKFFGLRQGAAG